MANDALVTQVALEAIVINTSNVRATQTVLEAVSIDSALARVTQTVIEAVCIDSASAQVSQVVMESVFNSTFGILPEYLTTSTSVSGFVIPAYNPVHIVNLNTALPAISDNVTLEYGTPIIACTKPLLCINPGPVNVANGLLPSFPLSGDTIAYNMAVAPVSLVINLVDNPTFPAGLYAFYEKNNSVWYKFKTATSGWSTLEYLDTCGNGVGVSDSRTIFDCAGYPITGYRDLNGNIGVHYYLDGVGIDNTTRFAGTSPNVIVYNDSIIVMFVPPDYTDSLAFVTSADCYVQECLYPINIPNTVTSFSLRQTANTDWTFTFVSVDSNNNSSIYYGEVFDDSVVAPALTTNLFRCPILPSLTNVQLINAGVQSYADNLMGYDFIVYRGVEATNDISGYSNPSNSFGNFTWTPSLGDYITYASRQDTTQDIKWPSLNVFNNKLGIAWLETHETGVLHLNYAESPITKSPVRANTLGKDQIYIYPFIPKTVTGTHTENIPFDSIKVIDVAGKIFPISTYVNSFGLGYNVETPDEVQAVRFLQTFRQNSQTLVIKLTTAPTMTQATGLVAPQPLPFYPITIYQGTSNLVFTKLKTALDGTVSVQIPKGIYSFEIQTLNDSVLWQQTLL